MKPRKIDPVEVWKHLEYQLAPRLRLNVIDRTVYMHLLYHSRLQGKLRLQFSIPWLARKVRITSGPVRNSIRRLADHGALQLVERNYDGHLVEVRLPAEVQPAQAGQTGASSGSKPSGGTEHERPDFLTTRALRRAIHAREGGQCFYCRRRIPVRARGLDHVVPRSKSGQSSYRNLVLCCLECNSQKKDHAAADFLRRLYREGSLSRKDLTARLRALRALAAGKLRPQVLSADDAGSEKGKASAMSS